MYLNWSGLERIYLTFKEFYQTKTNCGKLKLRMDGNYKIKFYFLQLKVWWYLSETYQMVSELSLLTSSYACLIISLSTRVGSATWNIINVSDSHASHLGIILGRSTDKLKYFLPSLTFGITYTPVNRGYH